MPTTEMTPTPNTISSSRLTHLPSSSPYSSPPSSSSSPFSLHDDNHHNDKDNHDDDDNLSLLPQPWFGVAVVCIAAAMVVAVGGNVLVMLSYRRDRRLRRDVHNLYLLNLAVCDLLIGAVSMPLYLVYTVLGWTWPLGTAMCKVFLVEDFTVCGMSTLIVVLLAWDRQRLLRLGASYQAIETHKRAYVKLIVCWVYSLLLYTPAILLWNVVTGGTTVLANDCDVEFHGSVLFVVITEVLSFSVPFLCLTVLNFRLFLALKKRRKVHRGNGETNTVGGPRSENCKVNVISSLGHRGRKIGNISEAQDWQLKQVAQEEPDTRIPSSVWTRNGSVAAKAGISLTPKSLMLSDHTRGSYQFRNERLAHKPRNRTQPVLLFSITTFANKSQEPICFSQDALTSKTTQMLNVSLSRTPSWSDRRFPHQAQTASLCQYKRHVKVISSSDISQTAQARQHGQSIHQTKDGRDRRIAVILTGLVLALVVFWLPYSVSTIIVAACNDCVSRSVYEVLNWLLWIKSCVNPFLYAYNCPRFRRNFRELLAPVLLLPARCMKAKRKSRIDHTC